MAFHPWRTLRHQWGRTLKPPKPAPELPDEEAKDTAILTSVSLSSWITHLAPQIRHDCFFSWNLPSSIESNGFCATKASR